MTDTIFVVGVNLCTVKPMGVASADAREARVCFNPTPKDNMENIVKALMHASLTQQTTIEENLN